MVDLKEFGVSPLSHQEAAYAQMLLEECQPEHLNGLVDLLRFGVAWAEGVSASAVVASWMLNASRNENLQLHGNYTRPDGSGFHLCEPDWLSEQLSVARLDGEAALKVFLDLLKAQFEIRTFEREDSPHLMSCLKSTLSSRACSTLVSKNADASRFHLVLALNAEREQVFVCEVDDLKARLRWHSLKRWLKQAESLILYTLSRAQTGIAIESDVRERGSKVIYLDTLEGLKLLRGAQGLSVVAYAALHGNTQRDLSSCQVASLSSLMLEKGKRSHMTSQAQKRVLVTESILNSPQAALRGLAKAQVKETVGTHFEFRGLGLAELQKLADDIGLKSEVHEVSTDAGVRNDEINRFRSRARAALGKTIVNFFRGTFEQSGTGHHAVLVAYQPKADMFLIDVPAGFKMPAFWVSTELLVEAMATFDDTKGVERNRGYLIVNENEVTNDLSLSVFIRRPKPI